MKPRARRLSEIVADIHDARLVSGGDTEITGITYDSRRAGHGDLFVAVPGLREDGLKFVHDAIARGVVAVLSERIPDDSIQIPLICAPNARRAMAEAALSFFDHPQRSLTLCAITGTNGKTTVATVLKQVLELSGIKSGVIGTLGVSYSGFEFDSPRTTPESVEIAAHLCEMKERGVTHVTMEATSIGIDLERTWGLPFRVAAFTNFTRDHLDYHRTFEAYLGAKLKLFRELPSDSTAIVNRDDPNSTEFEKAAPCPVLGYSLTGDGDILAREFTSHQGGMRYRVTVPSGEAIVETNLIGRFNVSNLLAVTAMGHVLGLTIEGVASALRHVRPARGRMQAIPSNAPFTVAIDFAHTPDALESVLKTAREIVSGRVIVVFGAGGDRDGGKRPVMGRVAATLSDFMIITSDNPRSEDPEIIMNEIVAGVPAGSKWTRVTDRAQAISFALQEAKESDLVLIAGKGHETYQEIGAEKIPFDDAQVSVCELRRLGYMT